MKTFIGTKFTIPYSAIAIRHLYGIPESPRDLSNYNKCTCFFAFSMRKYYERTWKTWTPHEGSMFSRVSPRSYQTHYHVHDVEIRLNYHCERSLWRRKGRILCTRCALCITLCRWSVFESKIIESHTWIVQACRGATRRGTAEQNSLSNLSNFSGIYQARRCMRN